MFLIALLLSALSIPQTMKSVVELKWMEGKEGMVCTGFYVRPNAILTAKHCIPPNPSIPLTADGKAVRVAKSDDQFALLITEDIRKALVFAPQRPEIQTPVVAIGNAWGAGLLTLGGNIARFDEGDLMIDRPVVPGMSGGPIVDGEGRVVGLTQATTTVVGLGCGIGEMKKFLGER